MIRPLPQKPLTVRGKTLGGTKPLICIPLAKVIGVKPTRAVAQMAKMKAKKGEYSVK